MILSWFVGLLAIVAVSGVGRLVLRPVRPLALHWYSALVMLAGVAVSSVSVQLLAMAGSGPGGFRGLGWALLAVGMAGHWIGRGRSTAIRLPPRWLLAVMGGVLVLPVGISMAPSSKIDELYYHMLVGRRVVEDHGLQVYQLPFEQAIVPQMGYQIAESVFHAAGTPDAGNVLSVAFGAAFWLLIYGVVTEETGRTEIGSLAALAAAIGIYPAVWYVTAGAHALGDLAAFTAVAALLYRKDDVGCFACVLGAACAASTKISMVPVGLVITAVAILRWRTRAATAGLWLLILGPLVIWTYLHTGSPFGAAFAGKFGQTVYQPSVMAALESTRKGTQAGLFVALSYAVQGLSGAGLVLMVWGAIRSRRLLLLVGFQVILIALFLPHDYRFLGGLQYGLLAAGAIGLGRFPVRWIAATAILLMAPWLAAEMYYARPMLAVSLGATTRQDFLRRYVAFIDDLAALDKLLPADATLYAPDWRLPAEYAPRPVIFTLLDWDHKRPVYRFDSEPDPACSEEVYRNPDAVAVTYRTPNSAPVRSPILVQRCLLP